MAEVGSVEDRNQALAAERADVSAWSRPCNTCGDEITKAVKALDDYAREYWERNRQEKLARERDDRGWNRS